MSDQQIRAATGDDLPGILDTLRAALGETPVLQRTAELWAWKHERNPFGHSIVMVADVRGRIAGVRAMMRWNLRTTAGRTLRCLRPVDTATHPEFRRLGIFRRLTEAVLETARSQGIDLIFNTPNEKSAPGYLKMGWREVGDIGVLVRPRIGFASPPPLDRPPALDEFAPHMTDFRESRPEVVDRRPLGLRTPRSDDYVDWRFGGHPTARYGWMRGRENSTLLARVGSRNGRAELVVSDLMGDPGPTVIHRAARAASVRYLAGWFSPQTPERRTAVRAGMIPVPGISALRLVALPLTNIEGDVFDLRSWDLSTSDLELL